MNIYAIEIQSFNWTLLLKIQILYNEWTKNLKNRIKFELDKGRERENLKKKRYVERKPYRELFELLAGIEISGCRGDFNCGGCRRVVVRELNDRKGLEGRRRRRGREQSVVAKSSEDLKEDLKEQGQPVQERPPYLQRPRRVYLGLSQLGHRHR